MNALTRLGAFGIAAAALAAALWRIPMLLHIGHEYVDGPTYSLSRSDVDPLQYFVSTQAIQTARQLIPPGATYSVVVGDEPPLENDDAVAIQPAIQFWLLPRRYTKDVHDAQWVIAYHHSSETVGVRYAKEIGLGPDANLLHVIR